MNIISRIFAKRKLKLPQHSALFAAPSKCRQVSIDCEMTGLNPREDHILSVAAIAIENNRILCGSGLYLICCPPRMPEADTIRIHGLRPEDVKSGITYAQMLEQLLVFIGCSPIIGYHIGIDMAFLNALCKPYLGTKLPNKSIDITNLYLKYQQRRGHFHNEKGFATILKELGIDNFGTHDAYNDALMTAMAYVHLR